MSLAVVEPFVVALTAEDLAAVEATFASVVPTLILVSMDDCPYCEKARAYLTEAGIPIGGPSR